MKLKLCFSALCAAAVILLASPAAYADSYDLSLGSISIDSTASGQTVVQNGKTAVDQAPVITQKSAEATQNTISVHASSGSKAVLTLDGVNIDTSSASDSGSPVSVSGSGSVKLCFRSENTLMAGRVPGIEKSAGGWLEIAGEDDAVLNTTGAPGIGSGFMASGDHLRISSGTVNATGLSSAAGIGSCDGGSSFRYIEINGGNVTAVGGEYSAGIGGGGGCDGSFITINGGTVYAEGSAGAGIGGGFCGDNTGSGYNITINGGDVKAVGRFGGAGIGSGASFYGGTNHGGYNIRITGGTVTAIAEAGTSKDGTPIYNGAAGIGGGGEYCFGRNISITGGEVTAAGNGGGAAIGGSRLGEGCTVKISKDAIVHAAMSVTSDGKYTGPCFGSGAGSDADGKEITPDYSALRKGGLVEFFDPDGKLLRSYSLDTPSGVLK